MNTSRTGRRLLHRPPHMLLAETGAGEWTLFPDAICFLDNNGQRIVLRKKTEFRSSGSP